MSKKYIYMWYNGDVKRHYFSSKLTFNKWLTEFVEEVLTTEDYYDSQLEKFKRTGSLKKEIKKYYSSDLFLEKIELDEGY